MIRLSVTSDQAQESGYSLSTLTTSMSSMADQPEVWQLESKSKEELVAILKEKGLKVSGNKNALVKRLLLQWNQ